MSDGLWRRCGKRCFDVGASTAALTLLSPLFAVISVAVRLSSPGPIFFRQERVGLNFVPFHVIKFRTMVQHASALGGPLTAGDNDPRITSLGRFLRKTKLDELPQLVNVWRGEMSMVGPRPEVSKYVELFRNDYTYLLSVRPGLTDPASIRYCDEGALLAQSAHPERTYVEQVLPDKLSQSRRYVEDLSCVCDMRLLTATALHLFWR